MSAVVTWANAAVWSMRARAAAATTLRAAIMGVSFANAGRGSVTDFINRCNRLQSLADPRGRSNSLVARGESLASHRDGRGAPPARRDDREYRKYLSEEQRSRRGCIARRMQPDFRHGLLGPGRLRSLFVVDP